MKIIKLLSITLVLLLLLTSMFACINTTPPDDDPSDGPSNQPSDPEDDNSLLKIDGNSIKNYVIVTNRAKTDLRTSAEVIKNFIKDNVGENLVISATPEEGKKAIYINEVQQAGKSGYQVKVENGDLIINCAYIALTKPATEEFIATELAGIADGINIPADYTYQAPIKTVKYSDYGAKGDGSSDDYAAIKAAHTDANKYGYTVEGDPNATYYLGATSHSTITVLTDTDWKGAKFIIDDRAINTKELASTVGVALFTVKPSLSALQITTADVPSLKTDASNLGYAPGVDCLVYVEYNGVKHYIRYGANANNGSNQQEILLVRADGTIDKNTRPIWDYPEVTKIWAVPIDEISITIKNGTFKTLANTINPDEYISVHRGIIINRSNTTVENVKHTVEQVEDYRAAYGGFFTVQKCNEVLIYNCEIFCHNSSYFKNDENQNVLLGSYELSASHANKVTYDKVIQTNFFDVENVTVHDQGLMGTNYCKNMYVENSRFARFDAHCQVYNLTVKKSDLQRVNTIGAGTVKIENTNIWGSFLADLRSDYGGLFMGDYHLKNVTMKYSGNDRIALFNTTWNNHFFGYTVYYPQNVYIDNLKVEKNGTIYLFTSGLDNRPDLTADTVSGKDNLNPVVPTKLIEIKSNPANTEIKINKGKTFANLVIKYPDGGEGGGNQGSSDLPQLDTYLVNCGFSDGISMNKDGFINSSSLDYAGQGSARLQIDGNGHSYLNLKIKDNGGDKALLFTGCGNPNGVEKGTNICVDVLPSMDTSYTEPEAHSKYKGKSFVVAFDIKPLAKTTDANDGQVAQLFTFCNYYSSNPNFVANGIVQMRLSDYSVFSIAGGTTTELGTLEIGKFSTIAMHVKVTENKFDLYINDTKVAENLQFLTETEISQILTYDENFELVESTKANKMEDFLITYARLARVNGWMIEGDIYEFDNAKLYFTSGNDYLGTGDLGASKQ